MDKFTIVRSIAAPLLRENIDTDIVIRIERLVGATKRSELGRHVFESWRYRPDGADPVAVCRTLFGCLGSSTASPQLLAAGLR